MGTIGIACIAGWMRVKLGGFLMDANECLKQALREMKDRSSTYDAPDGERSMAATVGAFNAITGHDLTEAQGWKFMVLLKLVRSEQGEHRDDNYVDGAAYFGLAGECGGVGAKSDCGELYVGDSETEVIGSGFDEVQHARGFDEMHDKMRAGLK